MNLRLVVNADDNKIGMLILRREQSSADHFHASVRCLDNDLFNGKVFSDKNVNVRLAILNLVGHDTFSFIYLFKVFEKNKQGDRTITTLLIY